jgi:hypothetical protein
MTDRYCVIGAGAAGITVAKNLKALGIPFDVIERENDVGGNWSFGQPNSSVYKSTHLLSSKPMTAYTDFPIPDDYPDYLSHDQVLAYLRSYARHFGIYEHIQFHTAVEKIVGVLGTPSPQSAPHREAWEQSAFGRRDSEPSLTVPTEWDVTLSNGKMRRYKGVIIANGHHWDANTPQFPGHFDGETLHTKQYKTPDMLRGKRVLVVGAGNSGCDLVVEAVHHAEKVFHSTRRGYYYIPKYLFGKPVDQFNEQAVRLRVPLPIRRVVNTLLIRAVLGDPQRIGLPKPDHKLLETHPIVNSQMLYHVGHGDIMPKLDVAKLCGDSVRFIDGSVEQIDLIIYATGFKINFPFIDQNYLNWQGVGPGLFLHAFHPQYDNLFVVGLLQPDSGIFWLMDVQAQLVARFIQTQQDAPTKADTFRRAKAGPQPNIRGGVKHVATPRHFLEIDHFAYKTQVKKLLAELR